MPAQKKRTFLIAVRATGDKALRQTVRSLKRVEKSTMAIKRQMQGLRSIFLATFAGASIGRIAQAADSIQLLSDRINIFTGDTVEGAKALDLLFDAANLTNTSVDSLAETFNRVALATQELGLNTNQLIGFTATLQNTFRLSGASIAESSAAAIQLSQGLASGQLRGQELRSVLEQNAVIGGILAETLGTTRGQLIKFAESGKITSEVVLTALASKAEELNKKAQGLGQTFGQTLTKAFNKSKKSLNELNKDFQLNERFAIVIEGITNNLDKLFRAGAVLGGAAIVANIGNIARALVALATPVNAVVTALTLVAAFWDEIPIVAEIAIQKIDKFFLSITKNINKLILSAGDGDNFLIKKIFGSESAQKTARDGLAANNAELEKIDKTVISLEKKLAGAKKPAGGALGAIESFGNGKYDQLIKNTEVTLEKLNMQFKKDNDIKRYQKGLDALERINLQKRFNEGRISLNEFTEGLIKAGDEADTLFGKLSQGFSIGSRKYVQSAQNLTLQFADFTESTFQGLEDAIFDFTKGTEDAFAKMTQAILDDLLKIAIRSQIISPIAGGLGSLFTAGGDSGFSTSVGGSVSNTSGALVAAKGAVLPFAQGGIVTRPTSFPLSSGTGLMAEAGAPEAVVPLTRTSNGDLGVQSIPNNVTVNVNNEAGVDVDVQSQQNGNSQVLDITITRAVNNAINAGRLDRSLSSNYGINRRGNR